MTNNPKNTGSDLQATSKLTIDAIHGITNIVEAVHRTIATGGLSSNKNRTTGIAGFVYRTIRAITNSAGQGLYGLLERLSRQMGEQKPTLGRERAVAALNGVLGDYLAIANNALAIEMCFRINGKALNKSEFQELCRQSNGKLAIMIHGLCMNDLQWSRKEHNHGLALQKELGYTPVYLYYNSGLHISENGEKFARLLHEFTETIELPDNLIFVTHSMGGLVARSACQLAQQAGHNWLFRLKKIIFLGTPHHGSPLEKGGNIIDNLLDSNQYSAPLSKLGKIRSSGITDLRYGYLSQSDWQHKDRFISGKDQRVPVPLPGHVSCYVIAAINSKKPSLLADQIIGDGLVPLNSALGKHKNKELELQIPADRQVTFRNLNHWDLLSAPEVYSTLIRFLE